LYHLLSGSFTFRSLREYNSDRRLVPRAAIRVEVGNTQIVLLLGRTVQVIDVHCALVIGPSVLGSLADLFVKLVR
jgi:hypothetical protein